MSFAVWGVFSVFGHGVVKETGALPGQKTIRTPQKEDHLCYY